MTVGFPLILNFWQIDRIIFNKSAASLMFPLQSSNGARWKRCADNGNLPLGLKPSAIPRRVAPWSLRQAALALARHTPASPVGATGPLILRRSCRLWLIGARFFMFVLKKRRWPDISTFRKRANALSSKSPNSR
jgi:hypothetical protein